MTTERNKDGYSKMVAQFVDTVDVVCPGCAKQAVVKGAGSGQPNVPAEVKLICIHCGHNKQLQEMPAAVLTTSSARAIPGKYLRIGGPTDPYFNLPLWLTAPCCDNILWAYNNAHLDFLHRHVEAKLRERNTEEWSNRSLGSRLPKWMTSKKNRAAVLKAINFLSLKR